jgi:hypothetical protein
MKSMILLLATLTFSGLTHAASRTVPATDITVKASSIDQVVRLVNKDVPGSHQTKVSVVVTDQGMSTDISPRYGLVLIFASFAEMGNLQASFNLAENGIYKLNSAVRKSAGIYEVKYKEYGDEAGFYEVTLKIDATQMFVDEKTTRKICGGDFCDEDLKTSITVTETGRRPL